MEDKTAIEAGLEVSEAQGKLSTAQLGADATVRDMKTVTAFASSASKAINFSDLLKDSK